MPTQNIPADLIQQVIDILRGDNPEVEIFTQGLRPGSGVMVYTGTLYGFTGDNALLVDNLTVKGAVVRSAAQFKINLSDVIEIRPVPGEKAQA